MATTIRPFTANRAISTKKDTGLLALNGRLRPTASRLRSPPGARKSPPRPRAAGQRGVRRSRNEDQTWSSGSCLKPPAQDRRRMYWRKTRFQLRSGISLSGSQNQRIKTGSCQSDGSISHDVQLAGSGRRGELVEPAVHFQAVANEPARPYRSGAGCQNRCPDRFLLQPPRRQRLGNSPGFQRSTGQRQRHVRIVDVLVHQQVLATDHVDVGFFDVFQWFQAHRFKWSGACFIRAASTS